MKKNNVVYLSVLTIFMMCLSFIGINEQKKQIDIYITEICIHNDTAAYDDNGNYGADYIELYNNSEVEINLEGYGFSDDMNEPYKYIFPSITIWPKSMLIVWCSPNIDDTSKYSSEYIPTSVHCPDVSLSKNEVVYISDIEGNIVDSVFVKDIPDNMTYSCSVNNFENYAVRSPSPYYLEKDFSDSLENTLSVDNTILQPVFSAESGFYDIPLHLEMECEKGEIFYTLDGSEPGSDSIRYQGGIDITEKSNEPNIYAGVPDISLFNPYLPENPIDKATVVRAVVIDKGKKSEEVTKTYFVGKKLTEKYKNIPIMTITMNPEDLFSSSRGIYVVGGVYTNFLYKFEENLINRNLWECNYTRKGRGWERSAGMEYYDKNHNLVFQQNVGVRIHGGYSTMFNQKSFNLYAREEYDGNAFFKHDFFDANYSKIVLRNGGAYDLYATKIRDVLNQKLVKNRSVGTQKAEPCIVFLNGEYWGLYNLQETICADYVKAYYDVDTEDSIIMKNNGVINGKSSQTKYYDSIISFAIENDLSIENNYRWIESKIDIQSFIDYYCFTIYVASCDSISNNFGRWRSRDINLSQYYDGKWRWLLYDTDDSVGMVSLLTSYDVDSFTDGHYSTTPMEDPLFSGLLNNEEFKRRFVISFMDMANNNFDYQVVSSIIDELAQTYKMPVIENHKRFRGDFIMSVYDAPYEYNGKYTEKEFEDDIEVIKEFYEKRFNYITKYLKEDLNLNGELIEVNVSPSTGGKISINTLSLGELETKYSGMYFTDYPIQLRCDVASGYEFMGWEVNGDMISKDQEILIDLKDKMNICAIISK